jgi:hypothetical protein
MLCVDVERNFMNIQIVDSGPPAITVKGIANLTPGIWSFTTTNWAIAHLVVTDSILFGKTNDEGFYLGCFVVYNGEIKTPRPSPNLDWTTVVFTKSREKLLIGNDD